MTENQNSNSNYQRNDRGRFNRPRSSKEWKLIEKMVMSSQDEHRKARRWGIFFKSLTFVYLFVMLMIFNPGMWDSGTVTASEPHVGLVDLKGMIMDDSEASADRLVSGLRDAFEAEHSKGVILRVNSPGGSPVQSGLVYREVQRLKQLHPEKKVYAVITDIGASGAYYISASADEIYADPASLVGSIGVVSDGFGFVGVMEKLGVERRVYTSGTNKAMLDPFQPEDPKQKEFFSSILSDVHQQFIDAVKEGRGDRIKDDDIVFSGLFWSGRQALELGLVDGLASPGQVAREIIGQEEIVDYTPRVSPLQAFTSRLGVSMADRLMATLGIGTISLK
ncbi:MAG: S49 family peptidase [Pseudomonadales bacterium]|jgi:protease IV|uniref:S49 family peptidase n=1 Tax=unclassified Ketobacter TaxID=2639109 RepID=UPI000C98B90F|nr:MULTISPECIES: S49 family peptidase [unclassified Ketobacter]MAA59197.1 S49 family peptidase [Pseudomonadales bacterium]TNC90358.1 MAG: S49 family peptidase [Alcanivorax sp.]HAG92778.1 S49 family peptidase [Gammaproteobacteria bacterium]MAQ26241.1 S49 family peptidase [Pseudomonadales bacterium]MCK5791782.1 S49 family peptidase [Ketobacter sp.]|tara:strand:- start:76685 stop:77689 length:1005 start_codon:yes stop_codon:yes gene_type:complete